MTKLLALTLSLICAGGHAMSADNEVNPTQVPAQIATPAGPGGDGLAVTFGDSAASVVISNTIPLKPEGLVLYNPTQIALPGKVVTRQEVSGEQAFFAWQADGAAVIVEQPISWTAPAFENGTIRFWDASREPIGPMIAETRRPRGRIRICNTWPNSDANLEVMTCVRGSGRCMVCITSYY